MFSEKVTSCPEKPGCVPQIRRRLPETGKMPTWWKLGGIISIVNIIIWLGIGGIWWKINGLW